MKVLLNFFSKRKNVLLSLLFVALFISLILIIKLPINQVFEYDPDEGFELIKSLLFLREFSLYKEIYNDQPPLFTLILSYWFKLLKPSACHGRILVLLFSGILLWAFYQTIKTLWGSFSGLVAIIFLLLSALYLRLSISVMIGIPSLAFAMLSIYCITLYRKSRLKYLLLLSGIFIALSLQTKLITAFLVPLIAFEITQTKWTDPNGKKLSDFLHALLLWFGSFLIVYLTIIIIFFHFDFPLIIQQLLQPHLKQIIVPGDDFSTIWRMILADYDIALLALMGIILLIKQKKWQLFFPVLWLTTALIILMLWRPIWDHYYLLVSIPICWLAAISFSQKTNKSKKMDIFLRWITVALIIITIARLPLKCYRTWRSVRISTGGKATSEEYALVNLLLRYKPYIRWVFTDRPIFAFYANMLVPPELSLTTEEKREFKDTMAQNYLIDKLQKYNPELILLDRFKFYGPQVISYIERNYTKIYPEHPEYDNIGIDYNTLFTHLRETIGNKPFSYPATDFTNIKLYLRKDIAER